MNMAENITENNSRPSGIDTETLSPTVSAADDFFRYVNGEWIDSYTLPEDRARFGSFDKLAEDAENHIRDILEDDDVPAQKSTALYKSFLDTEAIEKAGLNPIREDLNTIDTASSKAALTRVLGALNPAGGPDLIGMMVFANPGNPDVSIIHITQAGIALPDEAYYRENRYAPVREEYKKMVARLLTLSGYAVNNRAAEKQATTFLEVETRIASNHWDVVATRDEDKTYNPYTYAELTGAVQDFNLEEWVLSWQEAYNSHKSSQEQPVNLSKVLENTIVHEPSFLSGINEFWRGESLDNLKLWARVHVLISWAGSLPQDFQDARFDFYGKVLSGTTKQRDRWRRAVALVNGICGEDVGRIYVDRHFPASSKQRMEELVSNLIKAYEVSISSSNWLGKETQAKALEKLSQFTPMIGYTEHWRDYTALDISEDYGLIRNLRNASIYESGYQLAKAGKRVDKGEWLMNPQTVNAYYEPTSNVIVFPAAILQPPFFDANADDAMNYGGIGAVIGHEIGHGFDDQGSKYDGKGRLNDWWTPSDRAHFEERTKALIAQYDSYTPAQIAAKYKGEGKTDLPHVNGAFTIGENIGDLGGVNISIKAYALSLGAIDDSDSQITEALSKAPVIDGFSGIQRFFLSYASIWRGKNRDEYAEQMLQVDPHSPAEFRVNGIVRNVDRFYDAFNVTEDDEMWLPADERVRIW